MRIDPDCEYLFAQPGAKRWLSRPRGPKANAVFLATYSVEPKARTSDFIYSLDPRMLRLTEALRQRCNDSFPKDVLPSGFGGPTAVPGDFNALLNVSGYGMNPLPIPISNNASLIEANGLVADIRPQDLPWLNELVRLFFGHAVPADLHIRKEASTGFPYFTNDNTYKKLATLKILRNVDDFLKLATGKESDLREALNVYHTLNLFAIQERQQPNAITEKDGVLKSKDRTAPTEREAREGSYAGKTNADMTVRDDRGEVVEGHFAMRRRDVFGLNGPLNYALTAIIGCFREVYLNRFNFTYKTRDRADKKSKISKYKYTVGSDVKTMDKMIPKWFLDRVLAELSKYLDERVVEVMRRAYQAPYVAPSPWVVTPAGYNPVFGGDPLKPENMKQHVGLPSGVAFNPDWGKLWMTFCYVVMYKDVGALHKPGDLEPFLRGLNPNHALLDMSDDATFLTNSAVMAERFAKAKSPYVVLEQETPVIYLGDVFCEVAGEREVFANPLTYLVNMCCREDSIDKIARSKDAVINYCEGYLARFQTYSGTPIFREMNAIFEEEARKHLGINPTLIARSLAKRQKFNDIDSMVKANPHVLHYKVDPKTVSPEVLDEVVSTIPAGDFFNYIRHLFKVPTVNYEDFDDNRNYH